MKINIARPNKTTRIFGDLSVGQLFVYDGKLYTKVKTGGQPNNALVFVSDQPHEYARFEAYEQVIIPERVDVYTS